MAFYQNRPGYPAKRLGLTIRASAAVWLCIAVLWTAGLSSATYYETTGRGGILQQPALERRGKDIFGRVLRSRTRATEHN